MHGQFKVVDEWVAPLVDRRVEVIVIADPTLLLRVDIQEGIHEDIRLGIILGPMLLFRLALVHSTGESATFYHIIPCTSHKHPSLC